jgi:hypothetical protein|uniref:Uncharacterized protein n=1 Tax=Bionectria ochroleuca TaxID=29856 RepID=A0A8H7TS00_BIOOC
MPKDWVQKKAWAITTTVGLDTHSDPVDCLWTAQQLWAESVDLTLVRPGAEGPSKRNTSLVPPPNCFNLQPARNTYAG